MADETVKLGAWLCTATPPGLIDHPSQLDTLPLDWIAAEVPGTAASALRTAGRWSWDHQHDFDAEDWWFRCRIPGEPIGSSGTHEIEFGGLATVADAWLNGEHVLSSSNMHRTYRIDVEALIREDNELVVRCAALGPLLARRRRRPRWKASLVAHPNLRWFRTTLLGRMPSWIPPVAPVGPWRPVTLRTRPPVEMTSHRLEATIAGDEGQVDFMANLVTSDRREVLAATLEVGGQRAGLECTPDSDGHVVRGRVRVPDARPWWPATHGAQPLYEARLECRTTDGDHTIELGRTGFRSVSFSSPDDPELLVNGVGVFCRGACWGPLDAVSLAPSNEARRTALEQVRAAGMNMVRLVGSMTYETSDFFDLCDELGILVWQDLMFAEMDYPADDPEFMAEVVKEVAAVLTGLAGHPCVAAVCGGVDVCQQAAMAGQPRPTSTVHLFDEVLAGLVETHLPGVPYWPNTPSGGSQPFSNNVGLAHYFGVGAYRRPLTDARVTGVRFAPECLAWSHVPNEEAVDEFLAAGHAIHDPEWKRRVGRDPGSSWDTEDTRDHYVRELFGVDPGEVRIGDPERYLDLGRAASAEVMERTMSEWRRPSSTCHGALVLTLRDLFEGAGLGVIDHKGRPKSPYYALRRVLSPAALLLSDEGLDGLDVWMLNDGPAAIDGTLTLGSFFGEVVTATSETSVCLPARGSRRFAAEELLGGFMDITYAYRFGPPGIDAVAAYWHADGRLVARAVYRPRTGPLACGEIGLAGRAGQISEGVYDVEITTRLFARRVTLEAAGCEFSDNYFDMEPGGSVRVQAVTLRPFRARVRALNSLGAVPITVDDTQVDISSRPTADTSSRAHHDASA